jgi:ubiquinone/menaquinone biosynthesis C-methylase UbiE
MKNDNRRWRTRIKLFFELAFWRYKKVREGSLGNRHYKFFYTTYFSMTEQEYAGKTILDIGCGPRGSLEWAEMAAERIGLDPLADAYLKMGASSHKMTYVKGNAEKIPFPDGYFDFVSSFNSLDHVGDARKAAGEILRVLKKGGILLLIVDIHPRPTLTEPQTLWWNAAAKYFRGFEILEEKKLESVRRGKIYKNLRSAVPLRTPGKDRGVLTLKLLKR